MNKIVINRENGGLSRPASNKDGVVGLLIYMPSDSKTAIVTATGSAWANGSIALMGSAMDVEKSGLAGLNDWHARLLKMHLDAIYAKNASAMVYVGLSDAGADHSSYGDVETMQRYAKGDIRVIGIWEGGLTPKANIIAAMQTVAGKMEAEQMPLSIVWSCGGSAAELKTVNMRKTGQKNVSVVIGMDGDDPLYKDEGNKKSESTGIIGVVLGLISKAPVNESISWVEKYATGISHPLMGDGAEMSEVSTGDFAKLDENGYIMLRTYPGIEGSYLSDSHTMDVETSDYAHLEDERLMDKVARGVYVSLVRALGGKVYADESGALREDSRAMLEEKATETVDAMEKAGELSGYKVEISGDEVLRDGKIKAVIKSQPTGVVRELIVSIGYTDNLEK